MHPAHAAAKTSVQLGCPWPRPSPGSLGVVARRRRSEFGLDLRPGETGGVVSKRPGSFSPPATRARIRRREVSGHLLRGGFRGRGARRTVLPLRSSRWNCTCLRAHSRKFIRLWRLWRLWRCGEGEVGRKKGSGMRERYVRQGARARTVPAFALILVH